MSDRTYLEAWQQAHREAGADMDRVICERDEARAERDALAAQLEALERAAREVVNRDFVRGVTFDRAIGVLAALLAPVEPQPEPPRIVEIPMDALARSVVRRSPAPQPEPEPSE